MQVRQASSVQLRQVSKILVGHASPVHLWHLHLWRLHLWHPLHLCHL
jgi:hypothetical protein